MTEFDRKTSGILMLEHVEFNRVLCRKVIRSNAFGGRVSVPKEWIGKEVYIVVPRKKDKQ